MLIVAIGWLWVALMMAITERSVVAGVLTFFFYGVVPVTIIVFVFLGTRRRSKRPKPSVGETVHDPDRPNP